MKREKLIENPFLKMNQFQREFEKRLSKLKSSDKKFTLIALDFDNFNYINDLYGYEVGDDVLKNIQDYFAKSIKAVGVFSRIHADHFCFLLESDSENEVREFFAKISNLKEPLQNVLPSHYNLVACGGSIVVKDDRESFSALLDKANHARKKAKGHSHSHCYFYDDKLKNEVEWQKKVTLSMEQGLKNQEFEMYLQPKVLIKTGEVMGAEALVRWNSKSLGFLNPDKFIPTMEQSGFIRKIDFLMLEKACEFLNHCKELGIPQIPISVNFSKAHFRKDNFLNRIFEIVERFRISPKLIEIEFTESVFAEQTDKLIDFILKMKQSGFKISIDDFGRAYSSLSFLKELPVDIVKIDKSFLNSEDGDKGKLVISKIVELIKSLRLSSVIEGVEEKEQVDFLKKLSCDVAQGYFYARPMSVSKFIEFLNQEDVKVLTPFKTQKNEPETKSFTLPKEFTMDNWELFTLGKNIDLGIMKGHREGDKIIADYVNDKGLEIFGYTLEEFRDRFQNNVLSFIHPSEVEESLAKFNELKEFGKSVDFCNGGICKDGREIIIEGKISCVLDENRNVVGIYTFQDVTKEIRDREILNEKLNRKIKQLEELFLAEKKAKEELDYSKEKYFIIAQQSGDIMFEWDFATDSIVFSNRYREIFKRDPEVDKVSTSEKVRGRVHPHDRENFERWVKSTYKKKGKTTATFRMEDAFGTFIWMTCHCTTMVDKQGVPKSAVGVFTSVHDQVLKIEDLTSRATTDSLTKLLNKDECTRQIDGVLQNSDGQNGAFIMVDIDNFKGINDSLGHKVGDEILRDISTSIKKLFSRDAIVGRMGGDEIVVFVKEEEREQVEKYAAEIVNTTRLAYYGSSKKYNITVSLGIAFYPRHGTTFEELYLKSDIALYEAKNNGKNKYCIFSDERNTTLSSSSIPVKYFKGFLSEYFGEDIPYSVFDKLYTSVDVVKSIKGILEELGKKFNMDRVSIFEIDWESKMCHNTFEWCNEKVLPNMQDFQNMDIARFNDYVSHFSTEGVLCVDDTSDFWLSSGFYGKKAKSFLQCAFYENGKIKGFIGFESIKETHSWTGDEIAILGYVSRILSVFIHKNFSDNEIYKANENYAQMIDNLNGYVYVVDSETFDVLYVNKAMKNIGLGVGDKCYKMAFSENKQCDLCPIRQLTSKIDYAQEEIFSKVLNGYVLTSASKMKWQGVKDAVLVSCLDISKYKFPSTVFDSGEMASEN